jgi:transposase
VAVAPTEVCPPEVRFDGFFEEGTVCMIVIGADTHKSTHTLAAVDAATGRVVASKTVDAGRDGMLAAWRWAHALDGERVWAIEDCRHVSGRLERRMVAQGERVIRVPPKLMGQSRRGERSPGKSDRIDAVAVARAALREGVESLPSAYLDERAFEVRLLDDHRDDLVAERTRHQNRLRWHLVELDPELEAALPARGLDRTVWLDRIARRLAAMAQTARVRVARDELRRIRELTRAERELERELTAAIQTLRPDLLAEQGCGPITAATLIGHTAGAQRFPTDGHFAMQAGAAPIPCSSGRRDRVRLNRGGDRQLNCALHRIAITRARTDPTTRAYLDRKIAQGKTPREAMRCLKRHLARRIWRLLTDPAATPSLTSPGHPAPHTPPISVNAPNPMPCLT